MSDPADDRAARPGPDGSDPGPDEPWSAADPRPVGRPAPQYGEYAPAGWVNPVEVERARREREDAERRRTAGADQRGSVPGTPAGPPGRARDGIGRSGGTGRPGAPADRSPQGRPGTPSGRLGASTGDLLVTVVLLALGFSTVVQQLFSISRSAATIADQIAMRTTALADPGALVPATALCAVVDLLLFVGAVWWSVVRLRRRRVTFWVPLAAGALAGVVSVVVYVVVLAHDPAYVSWALDHSGI